MNNNPSSSNRYINSKEFQNYNRMDAASSSISCVNSQVDGGTKRKGKSTVFRKRIVMNSALKWNNPSSGGRLIKKAAPLDVVVISSEDESISTKKFPSSSNNDSAIVISSDEDSFCEPPPLSVNKEKQPKNLKRKLDLSASSDESDNKDPSKRQRGNSDEHRRLTPAEVRSLYERDRLSQQIREFLLDNEQQDSFLEKKYELAQGLESILSRSMIRDCQVHIVGSSVNGFGRRTSDCDLCLVVDEQAATIKKSRVNAILHQVKQLLHRAHFVQRLQFIPAKVRILKFEDGNTGMEVDLNVNNITGLRNTQLMFAYSQCDPRVRPLVLCVKEWAHQNGINDASRGTLSSYTLCLMIIHYLQCGVSPHVVPSLQEAHPRYFDPSLPIRALQQKAREVPVHRSPNPLPLSNLLVGFFRYFSAFDFSRVISVRLGKCLAADEGSDCWLDKVMRVEEPFDRTNVARAVRKENFPLILGQFRLASKVMKLGTDLHRFLASS